MAVAKNVPEPGEKATYAELAKHRMRRKGPIMRTERKRKHGGAQRCFNGVSDKELAVRQIMGTE